MQQVIEIEGKQWAVSHHALGRALDMQIEGADIRQALARPENVYRCRKYPNMRYHLYKDFSLSIAFDRGRIPTVCTILWASEQAWRDDLARGEYEGRALRS